MNRKIVAAIAGIIVIAGASFYGGMTYAKSITPARGQFSGGQFMGGTNGVRGTGIRGGANGGGFTAGEITSKDASSVTIKTQDGSTKIVLVGSRTQIMKSAAGLMEDLATGVNVTVTGAVNSDGSITAELLQIRSSLPERTN